MSTDFKREMIAVEKEISQLEKAIRRLLDKKQTLIARKEELKHKMNMQASEELAKIDWEKTDYPWSQNLMKQLQNVFRIKKLRPFQLSTMNATLSGNDCILIMPTGGGKSLCFQLPALLKPGVTLVVSPLVSLMEDQIMALENFKVPAAMLNATSTKEEKNAIQKDMIEKSSLKILYVTPEKLAKSKQFMSKLEKMYKNERFSTLVIDEVHCCSQWGHDFRPDYKFLGIMKRQFPKVPILGLTATATSRVTADVQKILNIQGCLVLKASFNRPNLKYEVSFKSSSSKESIDDLEFLLTKRFKGQSGIIYCFSIKESEDIALNLRKRGIQADCYHAQLDTKRRSIVHKKWSRNEIQVVVATVAFGMGIDKPDVRFVIHHSMSKSMENFYQESGRAGRDDQTSYCILFYRFSDMFRQSTMVFTQQTGLENLYGMVSYCLNLNRCRRSVIADHFGELWESSQCKEMCDICDSSTNYTYEDKDVADYCRALYKILEHASDIDERLTAQKLIDAWTGKGPPKLRAKNVTPTSLSRDIIERIIALLLIEGYLIEEFHFTPYSTISYINKGLRSEVLSDGKHQIIFSMPAKKRKFLEDLNKSTSSKMNNSNFSSNVIEKNVKKQRTSTVPKEKTGKTANHSNDESSVDLSTVKKIVQSLDNEVPTVLLSSSDDSLDYEDWKAISGSSCKRKVITTIE